jgi:ketosteroid isomerase-like protein
VSRQKPDVQSPNLPVPVAQFFRALNDHDLQLLHDCVHPDFEMVVPQKPARGFVGRDQEVANMKSLFDTYPDFAVTVLRSAVNGDEAWTETTATATGLEMAAVVIWTVDAATDTLLCGRYYSEPVQRDAPAIDAFMRDLTDR